jgi:hypothetical protein
MIGKDGEGVTGLNNFLGRKKCVQTGHIRELLGG